MNESDWYQFIGTIHGLSFAFNILLVVISDAHGFLWMRGKLTVLPARRMKRLHQAIGVGLTVSVLTGAYLASTELAYLLTVPAFYAKLVFVAALVANAFVIGRHLTIATTTPYDGVAKDTKRTLVISGAVSTIGWIGAFIAAQFLGL